MLERGLVALAIGIAFACGKPPKTTVDVDTMKEASFVKDLDDGGAPPPSKTPLFVKQDDPDDAPIPAAQPGTPGPASPPGKLPEPEVISQPKPPTKVDIAAGKKPGGSDRISAPECQRMIDHFFDLVLASDPRFADIGPEGKVMVRQIASQDQRFAQIARDCEAQVPRRKYDCAIASKSSAAWQNCLK